MLINPITTNHGNPHITKKRGIMNPKRDFRLCLCVVMTVTVFLVSTKCDSPTQSPTSNKSVVTLEEYHRIFDDMTLQEVQTVIGVTGKERSRTDRGTSRQFTWIWTNADGSHVICTFYGTPDPLSDGRPGYSQLTAKLQDGL